MGSTGQKGFNTLTLPVQAQSLVAWIAGAFALSVLVGVRSANADSISGLFNTGVDSSGTVLSNGVSDPHYTLISVPTGSTSSIQTMRVSGGGGAYGWLGDDSASDWIGPKTDSQSDDLPGNYDYQTTFTAASSGLVTLSGWWASDNTGEIYLDGSDTGQSAPSQFGAWNVFTINAPVVAGVNTLDFVVNNAGTSSNPTGVRVEFQQESFIPAASTPLPSAASGGLALLGLSCLLGSRAGRKRPAR